MNYTDAVHYIETLKPAGMQMGLERMETAVRALSHPQKAFKAVHIAGTKGKGSTAHMLAAMLTANGYRTGLFTSPVVTDLRDTIQINGSPVSCERFAACTARVKSAVAQGLSEFECLTAVMLCCFEEENVQIAVIECGLGGQTDATNILPPPLCAVFTPISLDHTAILGDTVEKIAQQKSGIIKPPCDVVCAPTIEDEALGVLFEKAAVSGQRIYIPSIGTRSASVTAAGTQFVYNGHEVVLSLLGQHQRDNALTALTALDCLKTKGFPCELESALAVLKNVTLPCRLEQFSTTPPVLLDGAHNPQSVSALCDVIDTVFDAPITLVIGMLADKDANECLRLLAKRSARIICCTPQNTPRALPAAELALVARKYHGNVQVIDDPVEAFLNAKKAAEQTPIVVGGSFYTAAVVRRAMV